MLEQEKPIIPTRYPFRIVCVYLDADNNDFPIIHEVRAHCGIHHLPFLARQYNIDKYTEDIPITRLPAFHIYYKGSVQETHYFDTDPVYKIQVLIWAYDDELRAKERARIRRQQQWDSFFEGMRSMFTFKRKTALNLEASLSSNTAGTSRADPCKQHQTPPHASAPERGETGPGAG